MKLNSQLKLSKYSIFLEKFDVCRTPFLSFDTDGSLDTSLLVNKRHFHFIFWCLSTLVKQLTFKILLNDPEDTHNIQSFIKSNLIQVCLPPAASKYVGDRATVIGWGRTAHGQRETPDRLQEVEVEVISQKKCQEWFESNNRRETIFKDAFICAGFAEGGRDSCQGDSGGPLVLNKVYQKTGLG